MCVRGVTGLVRPAFHYLEGIIRTMARIKHDLVGCVYVGAVPYFAGDTVPDGVVDPLFLESDDTPDVGVPVDNAGAGSGPVSADEAAYSEGADMSDVSGPAPEELEELAAFDPSDHGVRAVREYLAANPDDAERVLELEAAGQGRKSLIGE